MPGDGPGPGTARGTADSAVVVDAMGGDHGPDVVLAGAHRAADSGAAVIVVATDEVDTGGLPTVRCGSVIAMGEEPAMALRRHPDASIRVAAATAAEHPGRALLSAGSSGATVGAALLAMGRAGGIRRPVIAARLPLGAHGVVLVDAGADPDPDPADLLRCVPAARAYATALGAATPTVGVLNVGHEPGKGNAVARALSDALTGTPGFVGNVEPAHVLDGRADVVLTDGFTGNILLKTLEARGATGTGDRAALVLGVAGTVLVAHGAAGSADLAEAISMAARLTRAGTTTMIAGTTP